MTRDDRPQGPAVGCVVAPADHTLDRDLNVVAHPVPGARPGELIAVGPRHRWIAYQVDDQVVAAAYLDGALLRRDLCDWWAADLLGQRGAVPDVIVAALLGTVPAGWPVLVEQAPLLGAELLGVAS